MRTKAKSEFIVSHGAKNEPAKLLLLDEIKSSTANFTYPIADHKALAKLVSKEATFKLKGQDINASEAVPNIPLSFFPIKSAADFDAKINHVYNPEPIATLKHPTALRMPTSSSGK